MSGTLWLVRGLAAQKSAFADRPITIGQKAMLAPNIVFSPL